MKLELSHKEANLLSAILWELGDEHSEVLGGTYAAGPMWRLTDKGRDVAADVMRKLEDANNAAENKSGKDRDLSGAPKGTIQDARWNA